MTELEFGERLKQYRKQKGLTQQELADLLGVSNKSVSRWESGSYPDVAILGPLARALGVTVDDLLGETPPIRTLEKSDWQNLLSFAFAVGGGVLFFLLDLFTPTLVSYLLYLGALIYGVYLQKYYTYHSHWFLLSAGLMNFFVNSRLLSLLLPFLGYGTLRSLLTSLLVMEQVSSSYLLQSLLSFLLYLALYLALSVGITALTFFLLYRHSGGVRKSLSAFLTLERAPMNWRKWVPVGLMGLIALFWSLYRVPSSGTAILPEDFYLLQDDFYGLLLLACAVVCVLLFNWKGRRGMLLPSLAMIAACIPLQGLLTWDAAYSSGRVFFSNYYNSYTHHFGQPSAALYIVLLILTALYLLCCHLRLKRPNITSV